MILRHRLEDFELQIIDARFGFHRDLRYVAHVRNPCHEPIDESRFHRMEAFRMSDERSLFFAEGGANSNRHLSLHRNLDGPRVNDFRPVMGQIAHLCVAYDR